MIIVKTKETLQSDEITLQNKLDEFHNLMKMPRFAKLILLKAEQLKVLLKDEIEEFYTKTIESSADEYLPDNILYLDRSRLSADVDLEERHLNDLWDYLQTDKEAKTMLVHDWLYVLKPILTAKIDAQSS